MADLTVPAAPVAAPAIRVLRDDAAETLRGIAIVALAYLVMTSGDAAAKWVLPMTGVGGIMFLRGSFAAVSVLTIAQIRAPRGTWAWRRVMPVRWGMVFLRSACGAVSSVSWYIAWRTLSLADSYAIGFVAPLLMTLLAIPILGERIRWRRALSTALGFCGVLVMLRPGSDLWVPAAGIQLFGVMFMSVNRIMTRQLSTTETPECLAFWLMVFHIVPGLFLMLTIWPMNAALGVIGWAATIYLGMANGLAHTLHGRAYALAPIAALAPYEYTTLIWGGLFGYLLFGNVPSWNTLGGAAIVAAAGLYNLHRERLRRAQERAGAPCSP